jgi:PPE-repeat protein
LLDIVHRRGRSAAAQAKAAAAAFEAARAATVDPLLVAANRSAVVRLVVSNLFGQNAPAIAAVEGQYEQMWAADVAAMAVITPGRRRLRSWCRGRGRCEVCLACWGVPRRRPPSRASTWVLGTSAASTWAVATRATRTWAAVTSATSGLGNIGGTNLGSGNKGDTSLGSGNVGNFNLGSGNHGDTNLGSGNNGDTNLGSGNNGSFNLGSGNNGETSAVEIKATSTSAAGT